MESKDPFSPLWGKVTGLRFRVSARTLAPSDEGAVAQRLTPPAGGVQASNRRRRLLASRRERIPGGFHLCRNKTENWAFSLPPPFGHLPHQREASCAPPPRRGRCPHRPAPPAPHPNAFPSGDGGAQRRKRCLPLWGVAERSRVLNRQRLHNCPLSTVNSPSSFRVLFSTHCDGPALAWIIRI